jgi:hypothetical protein
LEGLFCIVVGCDLISKSPVEYVGLRRLHRKTCNTAGLSSVFLLNPLIERIIMKEILIPAIAILAIFGLPILMMLADIVAAIIERPRWLMQTVQEDAA